MNRVYGWLPFVSVMAGCAAPGYHIDSIESQVKYFKLDMRASKYSGPFIFQGLISPSPLVAEFDTFDDGKNRNHFYAQQVADGWRILPKREDEPAEFSSPPPMRMDNIAYPRCVNSFIPAARSVNGQFHWRGKIFTAALPDSYWYTCEGLIDQASRFTYLIYVFSSKLDPVGPRVGPFRNEDGALHLEIFDPQSEARIFHLAGFGRPIRLSITQVGSYIPFLSPYARFNYLLWQPNISEVIMIDVGGLSKDSGNESGRSQGR